MERLADRAPRCCPSGGAIQSARLGLAWRGVSLEICVVIPTYNEAQSLPQLVAELFSLGLEGNLLGPRFIPEIRYTRWTTQAFAAPDGAGLNRRNQFEILLTLMF